MLEIILCSLVTVLPDYLYRRYGQGKRIGHEITLFSVWYELRFGLITCLMLTVSLITMIFYFHPSTTSATLYFRTVPIISEAIGPGGGGSRRFQCAGQEGRRDLQAGQFKAAGGAGNRQDARSPRSMPSMLSAEADILKAEGQLQEAKGSLQQAQDELDVKSELQRAQPGHRAAA